MGRSIRLCLAAALLAGCRYAPLPPTAKAPPGYRAIRPAGPERVSSPAEVEAALAKRREALIGTLRGETEEDRAFAREELGRMGRLAVPALSALAGDDEADARAEAARALGATRCADALVPLLALAKDGDWSVREAAAEGIARLGDKRGGEALLALLGDDAWRVRLAAIRAAGEVAEARAVPAIAKLAEDVDEDVRYAAYVALGRIGDPGGREALLKGLDARDPSVRRASAEGLGRAGTAADLAALARRVMDESGEVRLAVVLSLAKLSGGIVPESARAAVEDWIDALGAPDPSVSYPARAALADVAPVALPWIVERLPSATETVQVELLALLKAHPDARALPACEALLGARDEAIRASVCDLLDGIHTPECAPLLGRIAVEGAADTRARALMALVRGWPEEAVEPVRRALGDADPRLRMAATQIMARLPSGPRAALLAERMAAEKDPHVRIGLVAQLGETDSEEARAALVAEWDRAEDVDLKRQALVELARRPKEGLRPLFGRALASTDDATRLTALQALVAKPDDETPALLERLLDTGDAFLAAPALDALARIAPARATARLKAALASKERETRLSAIRALGGMGTSEAAHAIEPSLGAEDPAVASGALDALAAMPAEVAAPAVLRVACEGADGSLRARAAMAFDFWEYVGAAPELRERLAVEDDPGVRAALVSALGMMRDEASVEAIAEAAKSDDPRLRDQALTMLGLVGTAKAVPPLVEALHDPDASIRRLATQALGNLRSPDGAQPLLERLADPDADVRREAAFALAASRDPARSQAVIEAIRSLHAELDGDALRLASAKELLGAGFPELAREEFENVLRSAPEGDLEDLEAYLQLMSILTSQRDWAGAVAYGGAALAMLPAAAPERAQVEADYAIVHGVALLAEGKEVHGMRELEAGLAKAGRSPEALNNAAYLLAEAGVSLDRAAALADGALARRPDDATILDTAGWVAHLQGDSKRAKGLLDRAFHLDGSIGEVAYHLARVEVSQGDAEAALGHLRRAIDRDAALARRIEMDPAFLPLRDDRRFQRLLAPTGPR